MRTSWNMIRKKIGTKLTSLIWEKFCKRLRKSQDCPRKVGQVMDMKNFVNIISELMRIRWTKSSKY